MSDSAIRSGIAAMLNTEILATQAQRITGGCSHECYRYNTQAGPVFVKSAPAETLDAFQAEASGLDELRSAGAIRVPKVLGCGRGGEHALLVLEWIDLRRSWSDATLGRQLAIQHRVTKPLFGWKRHNFIGPTPQINFWSRNWTNFWREHRFEAQLILAEQKGADDAFIERAALLSTLLDAFFVAYSPVASLLHGDLWNGNYACDADGGPVVFDPAVYYGDRECDLAMTRLFGGFGQEFYSAYETAWELDAGWRQRTGLYNLYHVLNHYNLFGANYLSQARVLVEKLLAELGH